MENNPIKILYKHFGEEKPRDQEMYSIANIFHEMGKDKDVEVFEEQKCRVCGCTWNYGCPEGCWWVEEDLCSSCVDKELIKGTLLRNYIWTSILGAKQ